MKRRLPDIVLVAACLSCFDGTASADIPYLQDFEVDTNGWTVYLSIERVPSGGGELGLPSPHGGYHAEIRNLPDDYNPARDEGQAGYTYFGGRVPVYRGDFFQAITVYIDAGNWTPGNGFWIDESPCGTNGSSAYADERNFRFTVQTQGMVEINIHGIAPFTTISNSAWHTFVETFRRNGTTMADRVQNDFLLYDTAGRLLASNTLTSNLASPLLGGNSYLWITVWANGFADDILAIDDACTGYLPFVPFRKPSGQSPLLIIR